MSKSAFSLRVFSIYMFALGLVLAVAPNLLLSFSGGEVITEVGAGVIEAKMLRGNV